MAPGQRLAIVGSRTFKGLWRVQRLVRQIRNDGVIIVSGGAAGPDTAAEVEARLRGLPVHTFKPRKVGADFRVFEAKPGELEKRREEFFSTFREAAFIRNQWIVDAADRLVAFWNGRSRGTVDTIEKADKKGIPVDIVYE